MKSAFLIATALAHSVSSAAVPEKTYPGHGSPRLFSRQGHGHGAAPAEPPKGMKTEEIKSVFGGDLKRVRVTYGRYNMKGFNETGGSMGPMAHEGGMHNASNKKAPFPCYDCILKYAKAFLTFPDGKSANFATGAYLHHLTGSVVGPGREDVACPGGTERIPKGMERMLAIHNDRNETFYGVTATDKMGFYIGKDDVFDLELLLKNELNKPQEVVFSIEWEFIPGKPAGYQAVKGIWMDVAPCSAMMSDIAPPTGKSQFTIDSKEWAIPFDGSLLNTVGHMHDGGVNVQISVNGKQVCESNAEYGTSPDYSSGADSKHISRYTPCINIGAVKKGDKLAISTTYDFDKYAPLLNKIGEKSHVMGLALLFVAVKA